METMKTKLFIYRVALLVFLFSPGMFAQTKVRAYSPPESIQANTISSIPNSSEHVRKLTDREPDVFRDVLFSLGASQAEVDDLLFICGEESDYNYKAKNPSSSASGICQYLTSTWNYQCEGDIWSIHDQAKCALKDLRAGRRKQWAVTW